MNRSIVAVLLLLLFATSAEAQKAKERAEEKKWDKKNNAQFVVDDETRAWNRDLKVPKAVHVRTNNFFLHFDIPKVKVGQRIFKRKDAALLYSRRLEELLRDWEAIFGEPYQYPQSGHFTVWMLAKERDSQRVRATLSSGGDKLFSSTDPHYIIGMDKKALNNDDALHANVYHHVSHLITQQGFNYGKGEPAGWFTAGVAHWLEIQKFGETRNFTSGEVATKKDRWQMGKWPKKVYAMARKGKAPKLTTFGNRSVKKLNPMLSAFSWSMVDFIIVTHPKKRHDFANDLAAGKSTPDTMRELLGWSLPRFHEEWTKYCIKNQGKSGMKPPKKRRR